MPKSSQTDRVQPTNQTFDFEIAERHIEVGAGRGDFGPRFYAPCVTTDIRWSPDLSVVCKGESLAFKSTSFSCVVICNPYGFGFTREDGKKLMAELIRVLRPDGTIIVIGHWQNPFCQHDRIRQIAESLSTPAARLTVTRRDISSGERFAGHVFQRADGSPTVPNVEIRVRLEP